MSQQLTSDVESQIPQPPTSPPTSSSTSSPNPSSTSTPTSSIQILPPPGHYPSTINPIYHSLLLPDPTLSYLHPSPHVKAGFPKMVITTLMFIQTVIDVATTVWYWNVETIPPDIPITSSSLDPPNPPLESPQNSGPDPVFALFLLSMFVIYCLGRGDRNSRDGNFGNGRRRGGRGYPGGWITGRSGGGVLEYARQERAILNALINGGAGGGDGGGSRDEEEGLITSDIARAVVRAGERDFTGDEYEALGDLRDVGGMGGRVTRERLDVVAPKRVMEGSGTTTASSPSCSSCAICMETITIGDEVRELSGCGHVFKAECIEKWTSDGNGWVCPVCKEEI